jgi:hypothetical protein
MVGLVTGEREANVCRAKAIGKASGQRIRNLKLFVELGNRRFVERGGASETSRRNFGVVEVENSWS